MRTTGPLSLLLTATVLLLNGLAYGEEPGDAVLAKVKTDTIEQLVSGCISAIAEPAFETYWQRQQERTKSTTSLEAAKTEMYASRPWKEVLEPAFRFGCECFQREGIRSIQEATSTEHVQVIVNQFRSKFFDPEYQAANRLEFERCGREMEQRMKPPNATDKKQ